MKVAVANGEHLPSSESCEQVLVHHSSNCFLGNFLLLPLVGFDLVLGVNWLSTLGPIWWDFNTLTMQFYLSGRKVSWSREKPSKNVALNAIQPISNQNFLDSLLDEFTAIFKEVTTLPPPWSCDHWIILSLGTDPMVVRTYRYP